MIGHNKPPVGRLTDKMIRTIDLPAKGVTRVTDTAQRGLSLRVTAGGVKTWTVRVSRGGKQQEVKLGRYPEVPLKEARDRAAGILAANDGGRAVETKVKVVHLFEDSYWPARKGQLKHPDFDLSSWKRHIEPKIGHLFVGDVNPSDVQRLYAHWRKIGLKSGMATPHRVLGHFFNWAVRQHLVDRSPVPREKPVRAGARERALTRDEIRKIWAWSDSEILGSRVTVHDSILRWLILTGCRKEEIVQARWSEIEGDILVIGKERMKNRRAHRVPILPEMMDWVPERRGDFLFSNSRYDGPSSMQWNGKRGWTSRICAETGVEPFVLHDLRRTLATRWAEDLRIDDATIALALGHKIPTVTRSVYIQETRVEERRDIMRRWLDLLDAEGPAIPAGPLPSRRL